MHANYTENGKIIIEQLKPIAYDPHNRKYLKFEKHIGNAFDIGNVFK